MEEIILLNSFEAFGVLAGEHGIVISKTDDYCVAVFSLADGKKVNLYLADEDYEYPDFTMADKEWIDKIDGSKLTWKDFE